MSKHCSGPDSPPGLPGSRTNFSCPRLKGSRLLSHRTPTYPYSHPHSVFSTVTISQPYTYLRVPRASKRAATPPLQWKSDSRTQHNHCPTALGLVQIALVVLLQFCATIVSPRQQRNRDSDHRTAPTIVRKERRARRWRASIPQVAHLVHTIGTLSFCPFQHSSIVERNTSSRGAGVSKDCGGSVLPRPSMVQPAHL